jgi:predicted acetyltransferase
VTVEVRTLGGDADVLAYQELLESAFGGDPDPEELATWRPLVERDRTYLAWDGATAAGSAGTFTFDMTVPGGPLPAAGVTGVSVPPTHRRRGVLTTLMRRQLDDVAARGTEPFATLWASEAAIYGRFGYGVAGRRAIATVHADRAALLGRPPAGRVRRVEAAEMRALAPPLYDAVRAEVPGMISRSGVRWDVRLLDLPGNRHGSSAQRTVVYEVDGTPRGYAWYRMKPDWSEGFPNGEIKVKELVAADADAHAGLWSFVLGVDLMRQVSWDNVPADDPLPHRLLDGRGVRAKVTDGLWVRVLDVPAALTRRAYATAGAVTVEVVDAFGGYAAGRWRLDASPDGATCVPSTGAADLTLSAAELGAVYLGDTPLRTLAAAGRVDEHRAGAVATASALFGWHRAAWCAEIF